MPLNANFIADFSSFLDATKSSIDATEQFEQKAAGVGPALDASLDQVGGTVTSTTDKLVNMGKALVTQEAIGELKNLSGAVVTFATTYINEYAEAEAATSRLNTALKASGEASPAVAQAYADMATELQRMSTFSDEAITDAQTLFTTIGQIKPDQMEATLKATMDLASGMKIDLVDAAKLVAKAAQSDGDELGKLKLILGDSLKPGADYADILKGIADKFGGQFEADVKTTAGQMENMNNQMSDLNETVGKVLADNLQVIMDLFQSLPEGIQTFVLAVVGIGTALAPVLMAIASLVTLLGAAGIGAISLAAVAWIGAIVAAIGALVAIFVYWDDIAAAFNNTWKVIVAVVEWAYNAIKMWLVDKLTWVFNQVTGLIGSVVKAFQWMADQIALHSIVPDMVNEISSQFRRLDGVMVRPALSAVGEVMDAFGGMGTAIKTLQPGAGGVAGRGAGTTNVTVNLSGMLSADDPQTRAAIRDVVSDALMPSMRGARLMGTA